MVQARDVCGVEWRAHGIWVPAGGPWIPPGRPKVPWSGGKLR